MIVGIGVDITDIARIHDAVNKGNAFVKKVLSETETIQYEKLTGIRQTEFIAGRFSAKESYSKAMGTGIGKAVSFGDVSIIDDKTGQPVITEQPFTGVAHVSISHTKSLVMTEVILERSDIK